MSSSQLDLVHLENSIKFKFKDITLLNHACTHSSALKKKTGNFVNNERLEFLGDAVLKLLISNYLYETFPDYNEGDLSKLRSYLVSDLFISKLARVINLGEFIHFSKAEYRSGASKRESILANAMEALIGACFLDQGLIATKTMFFNLFNQIKVDFNESIDYKSKLQEICQKNKINLPLYTVIKQTGPDHAKTFFVKAKVEFSDFSFFAQSSGSTKKQAEQLAAKQVLVYLDKK